MDSYPLYHQGSPIATSRGHVPFRGSVYILKKKEKKKTVSQQVKFLRPMCMCVGVAVDVGVGVGVCLCLCLCVGEESQRRESRTQTPRTISL